MQKSEKQLLSRYMYLVLFVDVFSSAINQQRWNIIFKFKNFNMLLGACLNTNNKMITRQTQQSSSATRNNSMTQDIPNFLKIKILVYSYLI